MNSWLIVLITLCSTYAICEIVKYICYTILTYKELQNSKGTIKDFEKKLDEHDPEEIINNVIEKKTKKKTKKEKEFDVID